jgi:hypothetical protein
MTLVLWPDLLGDTKPATAKLSLLQRPRQILTAEEAIEQVAIAGRYSL